MEDLTTVPDKVLQNSKAYWENYDYIIGKRVKDRVKLKSKDYRKKKKAKRRISKQSKRH